MAFLEILTWIVLGAALSGCVTGPRIEKIAVASVAALYGGVFGRSLPWQLSVADFSLSALLMAALSTMLALSLLRHLRRQRV